MIIFCGGEMMGKVWVLVGESGDEPDVLEMLMVQVYNLYGIAR